MTQRLYYNDCYLREFQARVMETADGGQRVYLDQTAFYPTSGGQPFDTGTLAGIPVIEVIDEQERIAHVLAAPLALQPARKVDGKIDWARRYDFMQQHTGQHLLSAVLIELFKIPTLSFHMGADVSTIEIGAASFDREQKARAEERCAEFVAQALPVTTGYENASENLSLRKPSKRGGELRIVSIGRRSAAAAIGAAEPAYDKSACGGTHVCSTAEIGPVLIRKAEKIRGNTRIEFVCGLRALRRARTDFAALQEIAQHLSVPPERAPAVVTAQIERIKSLEKSAQRLTIELAQREGKELWAAAAEDANGLRRVTQQGRLDDAMRTRAHAFIQQGKAVFLAISAEPPSVLLAASADSGIHAGERMKAAVAALGGRGGGNQALAQGSVPDAAKLPALVQAL